jgi:GNAT superfamily N-acetyltransferase
VLEVRPARDDDEVADAVALLARAAFGAAVGRLIAFPRTSPHGEVLVAVAETGAVQGAVCCASFGPTGWIGALGVAPPARRRGTGTALTEAACAWPRRAPRRRRGRPR